MLVKELIEQLKKQDPDMEVVGAEEVVFDLNNVGVHDVYTPSEPDSFKTCVVVS